MGVVLFTLAPPATAFSRGASHTSCQEMIPHHIRAHPQDPPHSYVTLRASASSYLPGQFITVTVRSSRDFMGFLLQARSVGRAGAGVEARASDEVGVRGGSRSSRIGPVLVGGSWTFTPPGTHTLRCLSEGDTLTHSDKQLKRNLSFVWRAPDVPMGDIRFYITVVQSYFVYWAGIKSEVVRDGSQKLWNGRKTTEKDGGTFAEQEDEWTGPTVSTASIPPTPPLVPTTSSYSLGSSYSIDSSVTPSFSGSPLSTSPHLGPSPAPLRSLYNSLLPSPSPMPSQKLTQGESSKIQKHLVPSDPEANLTPPTQRTVVHQIPDPHPKLDPNIKLNRGDELKPNHPNTDTKQKHPSNPSGTPDKEGKYPDIIPRHSAWELGMLLGCSAGLGMVLVVVVRYMYRQACGKRTGVTLNDREREYERGERGLIHVQECGDLVRVRRIRENSFVLLAEYDILASPGD
ncbi:uncharacterized protein LOC131456452 [Solea solea]|uniref:uncharacterized protein LOC131456452 n=1 Tax=Solea solea TaxID=90069 RepID=UPI00272C34F2|nr:uncharacterized protein LOC131456452 [Solea solea]